MRWFLLQSLCIYISVTFMEIYILYIYKCCSMLILISAVIIYRSEFQPSRLLLSQLQLFWSQCEILRCEKKRKLLISKTINSEEFSASFFSFKCKTACYFWEIFKYMLPDESKRLSSALLGYMFKDFCSVYGVWNALLENVQFAQAERTF